VTDTQTRTEILISGFGGQGVVRMGQILGLTGIKHDASNSRPEFSKLMRDLNHRIRAEMAAKQAAAASGNGHGGQ
jgi:hypothetical protein